MQYNYCLILKKHSKCMRQIIFFIKTKLPMQSAQNLLAHFLTKVLKFSYNCDEHILNKLYGVKYWGIKFCLSFQISITNRSLQKN